MLIGASRVGSSSIGSFRFPTTFGELVTAQILETFPLTPEFEYVETEEYNTVQFTSSGGYRQAYARWPDPKRMYTLVWHAATLSEKDQAVSFLRAHAGGSTNFSYTTQDKFSPPFNNADIRSVSQVTGSYASRTYYYAFTWSTSGGETTISNEDSVVMAADTLFLFQAPRFPKNVTALGLYMGTVSGTLTKQTSITTSNDTWTEVDGGGSNGLISGAAVPSSNAASEIVKMHLLEDSFVWGKISAGVYRMGMELEEQF